MKASTVFLLFALASQPILACASFFPMTGMTANELTEILPDIELAMIDEGINSENIISILAKSATCIHITTGKQLGPTEGGGYKNIFELVDGKWVLLYRTYWVS